MKAVQTDNGEDSVSFLHGSGHKGASRQFLSLRQNQFTFSVNVVHKSYIPRLAPSIHASWYSLGSSLNLEVKSLDNWRLETARGFDVVHLLCCRRKIMGHNVDSLDQTKVTTKSYVPWWYTRELCEKKTNLWRSRLWVLEATTTMKFHCMLIELGEMD